MQLDPNTSFSTQIAPLQGSDFENVVASCYYYLGYFVQRNIDIRVEKQSAAEIDVLASLITPLVEERYAIECKGQTPSFNDLRKFSTIRQIHFKKHVHFDLIAYGSNDIRNEHLKFSEILNIALYPKDDLSKIVLPIVQGTNQIAANRINWLNRYLAIFTIKDYYHKTVYAGITDPAIKSAISKYRRFLRSYLWSIEDPVEQLDLSFGKSRTEFNDFTAKIASLRGTTVDTQLSNPTDDVVQLGMLLELEHRIINLFSIARCTYLARSRNGRETIIQRTPTIRHELNRLCDYNMGITSFLNLIFRWVYLYGGIILKTNNLQNAEASNLANEAGISVENCKIFILILKGIYSSGRNLFYRDNGKFFMKYIPAAFRALGKIHRNATYNQYNGINLFSEDTANLAALDRALSSIGGHQNLRI